MFVFSVPDCREEATQEPANVTKHTHVHTTARFTISPSPQRRVFKRTATAPAHNSLDRPLQRQPAPRCHPTLAFVPLVGNETASYAARLCTTWDAAVLLPSLSGAFQEEQCCSAAEHKPRACHNLHPLPGPASCTSWESFVCMGQALTAQCTEQAPCANRVAGGDPPSQRVQGGTCLAGRAGSRPLVLCLQLEARESEASPCVRHSGALLSLI